MTRTVSWLEAVWVAQSVLFLCGALWVYRERWRDHQAALAPAQPPDDPVALEERFERLLIARGRLATIGVYCVMFAAFAIVGVFASLAPPAVHTQNRLAGIAAGFGFMLVNLLAGLDIVRMLRDRLTLRELWRNKHAARMAARAAVERTARE